MFRTPAITFHSFVRYQKPWTIDWSKAKYMVESSSQVIADRGKIISNFLDDVLPIFEKDKNTNNILAIYMNYASLYSNFANNPAAREVATHSVNKNPKLIELWQLYALIESHKPEISLYLYSQTLKTQFNLYKDSPTGNSKLISFCYSFVYFLLQNKMEKQALQVILYSLDLFYTSNGANKSIMDVDNDDIDERINDVPSGDDIELGNSKFEELLAKVELQSNVFLWLLYCIFKALSKAHAASFFEQAFTFIHDPAHRKFLHTE